jgi:hypothetical protein
MLCFLNFIENSIVLWWRFMGWNPNDYKAMPSIAKSRKWQDSGWLMVSWRSSCFYFLLICLYVGYGHFLHSISTTLACCRLGAFLVVLLILWWCFDGRRNKELKNKRRCCLKAKREKSLRNLWRRYVMFGVVEKALVVC